MVCPKCVNSFNVSVRTSLVRKQKPTWHWRWEVKVGGDAWDVEVGPELIWCCCCCCCSICCCCPGVWLPPAVPGLRTRRRRPSSPRSPHCRAPCCRTGRTGPPHRTCGHTPGKRSTPGGRRWSWLSSPSRMPGLFSCRQRSILWSQTACNSRGEGEEERSVSQTWGSLSYRGGGSPWCTETGPPLPVWHRSSRTSGSPRASRDPWPAVLLWENRPEHQYVLPTFNTNLSWIFLLQPAHSFTSLTFPCTPPLAVIIMSPREGRLRTTVDQCLYPGRGQRWDRPVSRPAPSSQWWVVRPEFI